MEYASREELLREAMLSSMQPALTPKEAELALDADWPVEPGEYVVGNIEGPVSISTLASPELAVELMRRLPAMVSIAGKTETCNTGIEKVVRNLVSNPCIRVLVVCGYDSLDLLPGRTMLCLAESGMDDAKQVIGAPGKGSRLLNLEPEEVERFRKQVRVVDMVGCQDVDRVASAVREAAATSRGRYEKGALKVAVAPRIGAGEPPSTRLDKAGYFVIYLDRARGKLVMEHYTNQGKMTVVVEGTHPAQLYCAAIERGLVSQLDHAAYLGRELGRAEVCLASGKAYVQDGAPR